MSYHRPDGVVKTGDYYCELNNCLFGGDVTGLNGVFRGRFAADAVDIVSNPTIAGRATAITVVSEQSGIFAPSQNRWERIASVNLNIPTEDTGGGYILAALKYDHIRNAGHTHSSENYRAFDERVMIGRLEVFRVSSIYASLWTFHPLRYNEYQVAINQTGLITVSIEQYYPDSDSNVHPNIGNRFVRVDYIRR